MMRTMQKAQEQAITSTATPKQEMKQRQQERCQSYLEQPSLAWITDSARTSAQKYGPSNPMHTVVHIGEHSSQEIDLSLHSAIGGWHHAPVAGDLLCAALAACQDQSIRVIATHLGLDITHLQVQAKAHVDVRGTLQLDPDVPVAFQKMELHIELSLAEGTSPRMRELLLKQAEKSCVVMQTLKPGVEIAIQDTERPQSSSR